MSTFFLLLLSMFACRRFFLCRVSALWRGCGAKSRRSSFRYGAFSKRIRAQIATKYFESDDENDATNVTTITVYATPSSPRSAASPSDHNNNRASLLLQSRSGWELAVRSERYAPIAHAMSEPPLQQGMTEGCIAATREQYDEEMTCDKNRINDSEGKRQT